MSQLKGKQIRAARVILGWSQDDLATKTQLGLRTVKRIESGEPTNASTDLLIRKVLEAEGIVFIFGPQDVSSRDIAFGVALLTQK